MAIVRGNYAAQQAYSREQQMQQEQKAHEEKMQQEQREREEQMEEQERTHLQIMAQEDPGSIQQTKQTEITESLHLMQQQQRQFGSDLEQMFEEQTKALQALLLEVMQRNSSTSTPQAADDGKTSTVRDEDGQQSRQMNTTQQNLQETLTTVEPPFSMDTPPQPPAPATNAFLQTTAWKPTESLSTTQQFLSDVKASPVPGVQQAPEFHVPDLIGDDGKDDPVSWWETCSTDVDVTKSEDSQKESYDSSQHAINSRDLVGSDHESRRLQSPGTEEQVLNAEDNNDDFFFITDDDSMKSDDKQEINHDSPCPTPWPGEEVSATPKTEPPETNKRELKRGDAGTGNLMNPQSKSIEMKTRDATPPPKMIIAFRRMASPRAFSHQKPKNHLSHIHTPSNIKLLCDPYRAKTKATDTPMPSKITRSDRRTAYRSTSTYHKTKFPLQNTISKLQKFPNTENICKPYRTETKKGTRTTDDIGSATVWPHNKRPPDLPDSSTRGGSMSILNGPKVYGTQSLMNLLTVSI